MIIKLSNFASQHLCGEKRKMENSELQKLLNTAIEAAEEASLEILKIYESDDFDMEQKDDLSPLTRADKRGHEVIMQHLLKTRLPMLSEEGKSIPYADRVKWEYFWMVDPLDGTKEFIKRNGEFTVNIALIHNGDPILGVVAVPVANEIYYGGIDFGVTLKKDGVETQLETRKPADLEQPGLRVVASRSHLNEETENFINSLTAPTTVSKGSSLKFMLLVTGKANVYPRFAPTMEWDTAAADALVRAIGLGVYQHQSTDLLQYNKENLLNPYFVCV